jgi:hypothetical protein
MPLHEEICCREAVDLSTTYLEAALDETTLQSFEQHLLICEGCSGYVDQLIDSLELVGRLGAGAGRRAGVAPRRARRSGVLHRTIAYKFLREGAIAPFARVPWRRPGAAGEPGAWVGDGPLPVHGCRLRHLPYWLNDELWQVELEGDVDEVGWALLSTRGRLLQPVDGWTEEALALAASCAEVVRDAAGDVLAERGLCDEARSLGAAPWDALAETVDTMPWVRDSACTRAAVDYAVTAASCLGDPVGAAFMAAVAVGHRDGDRAAVLRERARQAAWLAARLGLHDAQAVAAPRESETEGARAPFR